MHRSLDRRDRDAPPPRTPREARLDRRSSGVESRVSQQSELSHSRPAPDSAPLREMTRRLGPIARIRRTGIPGRGIGSRRRSAVAARRRWQHTVQTEPPPLLLLLLLLLLLRAWAVRVGTTAAAATVVGSGSALAGLASGGATGACLVDGWLGRRRSGRGRSGLARKEGAAR